MVSRATVVVAHSVIVVSEVQRALWATVTVVGIHVGKEVVVTGIGSSGIDNMGGMLVITVDMIVDSEKLEI